MNNQTIINAAKLAIAAGNAALAAELLMGIASSDTTTPAQTIIDATVIPAVTPTVNVGNGATPAAQTARQRKPRQFSGKRSEYQPVMVKVREKVKRGRNAGKTRTVEQFAAEADVTVNGKVGALPASYRPTLAAIMRKWAETGTGSTHAELVAVTKQPPKTIESALYNLRVVGAITSARDRGEE